MPLRSEPSPASLPSPRSVWPRAPAWDLVIGLGPPLPDEPAARAGFFFLAPQNLNRRFARLTTRLFAEAQWRMNPIARFIPCSPPRPQQCVQRVVYLVGPFDGVMLAGRLSLSLLSEIERLTHCCEDVNASPLDERMSKPKDNTVYVLVRRNKEPSPPSKHSVTTECTFGEEDYGTWCLLRLIVVIWGSSLF